MDQTAEKLFRFRSLFILVQSFFLIIMWLFLDDSTVMSQAEYIRLYSYWNIVSYAFLFYKELKLSEGLQPVIFIALITIQFVGLNGLSIANQLDEGETFLFVSSVITPYLGTSMWFLSLEHILILSGYYLVAYLNRNKPLSTPIQLIRETHIDYVKWALRMYVFVWALRIINFIIPLASLTSLLVGFANKGQLIVLTFLAYQILKKSDPKITRLYWAITVFEIFLVLGHGMKEEIIQNLIPYIIYMIIGYKAGIIQLSSKLILKLSLLGIVVLFFVFPYVAIFRDISNRKHISWSEVEISEALSEYGDYLFKDGRYKNADQSEMSTDYLMSRAGSIGCNAWSIHYAQHHEPVYKYFYYCAAMAVPRFLWPNKPPNVIGSMMVFFAGGNSNWEDIAIRKYNAGENVFSVTIGFIGGAYFSLGLWAAFLLPFIAGMFVCWYWRILQPIMSYNIIALWAIYGLISMILQDFQAFVDGGFTFYISGIMYVFLARKVFPMTKFINSK